MAIGRPGKTGCLEKGLLWERLQKAGQATSRGSMPPQRPPEVTAGKEAPERGLCCGKGTEHV